MKQRFALGCPVHDHILAPVHVGLHQHAGKNAVAVNAAGSECVLIAKGGAITDVNDTNELCFASMLGGDDGRTLFMMMGSAPPGESRPETALGNIRVASVEVPHAGRP